MLWRPQAILVDYLQHWFGTLFRYLQDLTGAVRPSLMMEKIELDSVKADPLKRRKWHMQVCRCRRVSS